MRSGKIRGMVLAGKLLIAVRSAPEFTFAVPGKYTTVIGFLGIVGFTDLPSGG